MKRHHQLLFELIKLRDTDYDLFLEKLYEAVTSDFEKVFRTELLKDDENKKTLKMMIDHFEKKEEYEKCDVLLHFLNSSNE